MRPATREDMPAILSFLKDDVINCLYMYINLKVYGLDNPNMPVWVEERDGKLNTVVIRYYMALRVYCRVEDDTAFESVRALAEQQPYKLLFSTYTMAERFHAAASERYLLEKGAVTNQTRYRNFDFSLVEQAAEEDVPEIASLILEDEYYHGQYTPETLQQEILERMRTGMGRNFIIRMDGRIVAHTSTTAEVDDIALGSLFICHREYRNRFLGETMESYIVKKMLDEGKQLYGFVLDERRLAVIMRQRDAAKTFYGKLTRVDSI